MKTLSTTLKIAAFLLVNIFYFQIDGVESLSQLAIYAINELGLAAGCVWIALEIDKSIKREKELKK